MSRFNATVHIPMGTVMAAAQAALARTVSDASKMLKKQWTANAQGIGTPQLRERHAEEMTISVDGNTITGTVGGAKAPTQERSGETNQFSVPAHIETRQAPFDMKPGLLKQFARYNPVQGRSLSAAGPSKGRTKPAQGLPSRRVPITDSGLRYGGNIIRWVTVTAASPGWAHPGIHGPRTYGAKAGADVAKAIPRMFAENLKRALAGGGA